MPFSRFFTSRRFFCLVDDDRIDVAAPSNYINKKFRMKGFLLVVTIKSAVLFQCDTSTMDNRRRVFLITSIDEEEQKEFFSQLTAQRNEPIVVDLHSPKRRSAVLKQVEEEEETENEEEDGRRFVSIQSATKRRKADLTCVICHGRAFGYNFEQITCESCKGFLVLFSSVADRSSRFSFSAFFRRNALHPIVGSSATNETKRMFCFSFEGKNQMFQSESNIAERTL